MRGAKTKSVVSMSKAERVVHQCSPNHSSITPLWWNPSSHVPDNTSPAINSNSEVIEGQLVVPRSAVLWGGGGGVQTYL